MGARSAFSDQCNGWSTLDGGREYATNTTGLTIFTLTMSDAADGTTGGRRAAEVGGGVLLWRSANQLQADTFKCQPAAAGIRLSSNM